MSTSTHSTAEPEKINKGHAGGLSRGIAVGTGLGVALWLTTGQFVFFPIFIGVGLTIGTALNAKKKEENTGEEVREDDV